MGWEAGRLGRENQNHRTAEPQSNRTAEVRTADNKVEKGPQIMGIRRIRKRGKL
jgi:hypothetical protein